MPDFSRFGRTTYVLVGTGLVVLILSCVTVFFLLNRKTQPQTCDILFYDKLKDHLVKDVFSQLIGIYSDVWSSRHEPEAVCSFFNLRSDGMAMEGYRNNTGYLFSDYGHFSNRSDGVIDISLENDRTQVSGKIFPLYFDTHVYGGIICHESGGTPHWRSVISVEYFLLYHPKTSNLVSEALRVFGRLSEELVLPINNGEHYVDPCYEPAIWRDYTKNSSY